MRGALAWLCDSFPQRAAKVRRLLVDGGFTPEEAGDAVRFRSGRPVGIPDTYPTFGGTRRPPSPLLRARYRLAGTLNDIGWSFPSAKRLESVHRSRAVRAAYQAHARHWDGSAPMRLPADDLSIAAILSAADAGIAYLAWSDAAEPEIWTYADGDERRYADLAEFIESLAALGA